MGIYYKEEWKNHLDENRLELVLKINDLCKFAINQTYTEISKEKVHKLITDLIEKVNKDLYYQLLEILTEIKK